MTRVAATYLIMLLCMGCAAAVQAPTLEDARAAYSQGQTAEAIRIADAVIEKAPTDHLAYQYKGLFVRRMAHERKDARLFDEAIGLFEKSLSLMPDEANRILTLGNIGTTYFEAGDYAKAESTLLECHKQSGRPYYLAVAAQCTAKRGDGPAAIARVAKLTQDLVESADTPTNAGLTAYNLALVYVYAGRPPDAVRWLQLALQQRPEVYRESILTDPDLDPIRSTTAFQDLVDSLR